MTTYGAEVKVEVDDRPAGLYAVAVSAPNEQAARERLLEQERSAWATAYPDRQSLSIEIVSIGRAENG